MKAVIMAGGQGTRIKSITKDEIPKTMLKVGNKTILEYQIDCLKKAEIDEIIIVVGHLKELIKDYFKDGEGYGIKISYYEEINPLGTGGSLYYLKDYIKDDFVFLYGDIFLNVNLNNMIKYHKRNKSDVTILVQPTSHAYDVDLVVLNDDKVINYIHKGPKEDYINLGNSGIFCFSPRIFDYIKENQIQDVERDIISKMFQNTNVYAYKTHEYLKDMGTVDRYNELINDFKKGITNNKKKVFIFDINDIMFNDKFFKKIKKLNQSKYLCICTYDYMNDYTRKKIDTTLGNKGLYIDIYCMKDKLDSLIKSLKKEDYHE